MEQIDTRYVLKILQKESIRYIDGRYSDGFVDKRELDEAIMHGQAKLITVQGMKFVKLVNAGNP